MTDMHLSTLLWNDFLRAEGHQGGAVEESPQGAGAERLDGRQLQLLSSVRVELSVEIGRLNLSLGDLLELSKGTRLDLQLQEDLPVTLSIDSVPIASGRVVFDGDEPSVEITELHDEAKNSGNKGLKTGEQ